MNLHQPIQFRLTEGINAYDPEITAKELTFAYLTNVEPRLGRLFQTRGVSIFQQFATEFGSVVTFATYQLSNRRFSNLYAITKTSIYWFNFATNAFVETPIYTGFTSSDEPYTVLPWYDALYVTKLGNPYVQLERNVATVVTGGISARYGIVFNSHAYLAGVSDLVSTELARVRWSDLDAPESFSIDTTASEADFFDLEPDSRQITGLSHQRGQALVYTENSIWVGSYIGFPGGFRHDPLYTGIGNIFHDAVVRAKDVDYFIGPDNFYEMNGFQLVPIGDAIYERFIADVNLTPASGLSLTSVRGYLDTRAGQVFWIYTSVSHAGLWSVVYNYKEKKWSERGARHISGWFDSPRVALRGYDAIDDVATVIDSASGLIDDPAAGYPLIIPQLVGASFNLPMMVGKLAGAVLQYALLTNDASVIETTDFYFDNFHAKKEITKVVVDITGGGTVPVTVQVGTRQNQQASVTWATALTMSSATDGSFSFFIRSQGQGKYIRFRFTAVNTSETNYITDYRLISFVKVEDSDGDSSK